MVDAAGPCVVEPEPVATGPVPVVDCCPGLIVLSPVAVTVTVAVLLTT